MSQTFAVDKYELWGAIPIPIGSKLSCNTYTINQRCQHTPPQRTVIARESQNSPQKVTTLVWWPLSAPSHWPTLWSGPQTF